MPFIEFDVRRPVIRLDAGRYTERPSWSVAFELYFARQFGGEEVRLKTEEKELCHLNGRVGFAVRDEQGGAAEKGELYYSPGREGDIMPSPAAYSVSLWISPEQNDRLISLVQSGVPLTRLSIETGDGVEYGWEPDGSGKEWDNLASPKVSLMGFSLHFGAHEDDLLEEDAEPSKSILDEAVAPDNFRETALAKLGEFNTRLGWMIALIVVGIGVVAVGR